MPYEIKNVLSKILKVLISEVFRIFKDKEFQRVGAVTGKDLSPIVFLVSCLYLAGKKPFEFHRSL